MNSWDLDNDLHDAAQRISELSRRVTLNPQHKARLREELLRRHQELTAEHTQRAVGKLWPRFSGLKRLTLVAPPALAAALALTVGLWSLQITGHQQTQGAEAARINHAFAQTAHSIAGWQWTLHQLVTGREPAVYRYAGRLTKQQQLYIDSGTTYLSSGSRIFRVTSQALMPDAVKRNLSTSSDIGWAFATLPNTLLSPRVTFVSTSRVGGREVQAVRYTLGSSSGASATITAWLDRTSGLLVRLQRVVVANGKTMETDVVDYRYTITR